MHQPEFHGMLGVFGMLLDVETRQQLKYVAQLQLTTAAALHPCPPQQTSKAESWLGHSRGEKPMVSFFDAPFRAMLKVLAKLLYTNVFHKLALTILLQAMSTTYLTKKTTLCRQKHLHYPAPLPGLSGLLSAAPSGNSVHTIFLLCFDSMMG